MSDAETTGATPVAIAPPVSKVEGKRRHNVRNILIVKPSSMGDIVHTFAAAQLLHENYPKAAIDWLVHPNFIELLDYCPAPINERIFFRRKELGHFLKFFVYFPRLMRTLRKKRYGLVLDFQGLFRSAAVAALARHTDLIGFADSREAIAARLYKTKVDIPDNVRDSNSRYLALAASCCELALEKRVELPVHKYNIRAAAEKLQNRGISMSGNYIAVFPRARWKTKTFPKKLFVKLISDLQGKFPEVEFVLMGAKDDRSRIKTIAGMTARPCAVLAGDTTVGQMVEILRAARMVIGNDSGPMHIAAALNTPGVAFYGASSPDLTGPAGSSIEVIQSSAPCLGCLKRECADAGELCHKVNYDKLFKCASKILQGRLSANTTTSNKEGARE